MEEQIKNIGLYAIRTASHKISFKLSESREALNKQEKEGKINSVERYEEEEKYIGGKTTLEDLQENETLELDENVLIDTSRSKNIVSTQINGQNGTVKEWINDGDLQITLTIQVWDDMDYPQQRLKEIKDFLKRNRALKIHNKHLNDEDGVTRIVVTGWRHTPKTWANGQTITVDCVSDETYIIEEEIMS